MKTSSAKAKGQRASKEAKELLLEHAPELEDADISVVPSGVTGKDLWLSPAAKKVYPFAIEVKNQEALNIWAALDQAESHRVSQDEYPVLFFRRNRSKLYVAMEAKDFLTLVGKKRRDL